MREISVKELLKEKTVIRLPRETFCKSTCWDCIYYRTEEGRDTKGQYRCEYRGRWYFPHEGCGNGIPRSERPVPQPKPQPQPQPQPRPQPRPAPSPTTRRTTSDSGGCMAVVAVIVVIGYILFNMGIIGSATKFRLTEGGAASPGSVLTLVKIDDGYGSSEDGFFSYTARQYDINGSGYWDIELRKGDYDAWISYDGVSNTSTNVEINSVFSSTAEILPWDPETCDIRAACLTISSGINRPVVTDSLEITDENGSRIPCTPCGAAGCYVLSLPGDRAPAAPMTVTIRAEGFRDCTLTLDFSDSRFAEETVKLTEK